MSGPFNYIPFGDEPGQACPITSQDTYTSVGAPLSVVGSGGGGGAVTSVSGVGSILVTPTTGSVLVSLKNDVNASTLNFPVGAGQITGVSSINGAVYPPPAGSVPTNLEVSTITFPAGQGQLINVSTVNGAPYGAGGSVPANLEVSSLTVAQTGDILLNGNAPVNAFPSITWRNTNYLPSGANGYSTISLDMQIMNPFILPPGAPNTNGADSYACPTFELNGPNGPTTCPISASALILGFDTGQVSSPTLYTAANSVSTLYVGATSSITLNTASLWCSPSLDNISSINGVSWARISTVVGNAP